MTKLALLLASALACGSSAGIPPAAARADSGWETLPAPSPASVPVDAFTMLGRAAIAIQRERGVFISRDDGRTWTRAPIARCMSAVHVDPASSAIALLIPCSDTEPGYETIDGGRTWRPTAAGATALAASGESVYGLPRIGNGPETTSGVAVSRDGGATFEVPAGSRALSVTRSPAFVSVGARGAVYVEGCPAGGDTRHATRCDVVVRSLDQGRTVENLPPVSGPLYADPHDADAVYATTGATVVRWRRADGAWTVLFTAPGGKDVLSFAADPDRAGVLYVGSGNGVWISRDAGGTFAALPPPPTAARGLVASGGRLFAFESLGGFAWEGLTP